LKIQIWDIFTNSDKFAICPERQEKNNMRVSDDRYSRDRQRLDLALRFIHHEARTRTIRTWTGLTDDRIRKLYRSYVADDNTSQVARHRGKSPQQVAFFVRTPVMRQEASVLASVCYLLGVRCLRNLSHARTQPTYQFRARRVLSYCTSPRRRTARLALQRLHGPHRGRSLWRRTASLPVL
jgi:hypothetical protein